VLKSRKLSTEVITTSFYPTELDHLVGGEYSFQSTIQGRLVGCSSDHGEDRAGRSEPIRAAQIRSRRGTLRKKLTKEQKRQAAVIAAKTDADIDLSDAPEVADWSGAKIGKFYRPPKPVTMRLDIDIIKWLKSHGRGYQTRVNALLRHAMNSRWAARDEDGALRQKAQTAYEELHAKRASGGIKRIHSDKFRANEG
jgi:uncharacterized protein (DUF4415 family)